MPGNMMAHMNGYGWGHMLFGGFMMVLFWGGLIALVIWLLRGLGRRDAGVQRQPSALDLLQERYARGEIDEQEYEERKRVLTH
ncbi:SHOCT domain-containing protein [Halomonas sp. PR-M31]|uniref:SHOCT domain-containing protein n=1 Tax=Halomonas sp. PR-M31 TaxID=1471202 RepID=UPI0009E50688|nr:SHOCT domain-containing protein [Halomonas sp. PR-M31]